MTPEIEEDALMALMKNVDDGILNEDQALSLLRAEGFDVDAVLSTMDQPDRAPLVNQSITMPGPAEPFVDPENL